MATTDWPANLEPQTFSPGLRKAGLQFRSPFNGTVQAVDFVAERWVWSMGLRPARRVDAKAAQIEALLFNLAGGIERVRCWHFARPQPYGTLRGAPTLASAAARGDTSIALTGAAAPPNLLSSGGFEVDTNADGLADGWEGYFEGGASSRIWSRVAGTGSAWAQRCSANLATTNDLVGIRRVSSVAILPNTVYTLAVDVVANTAAANVTLYIDWFNAAGGFVSASLASAASSTTPTRRTLTATAPATAAQARVYLWIIHIGTAVSPAQLTVDNVQFEASSSASPSGGPPTLKAGDMLGAGGQLFMVRADTQLDDAGAGTVPLVNRVRATIASGAAVTWDRPSAEFIMPAQFAASSWRPAILNGVPFDLEEVW